MFIRGVSTRGVSQVFEELTGSQASPSTVSRVFHTLQEEFEAWKRRPLAERYEYVFADGTYFTVIYGQEGCKMPILAAVGIRPDGEREVLGFTIGDRENQQAWEDLFEDLKQRGVREMACASPMVTRPRSMPWKPSSLTRLVSAALSTRWRMS